MLVRYCLYTCFKFIVLFKYCTTLLIAQKWLFGIYVLLIKLVKCKNGVKLSFTRKISQFFDEVLIYM